MFAQIPDVCVATRRLPHQLRAIDLPDSIAPESPEGKLGVQRLAMRPKVAQQVAEFCLRKREWRQALLAAQAPADGPENKQGFVRRSFPISGAPQPQ